MRLDPYAVALVVLSLASFGCSGNRPVQTEVLLNHQHCQTLKPGVTEVTVAQVPGIRGSRLLQDPTQQSARSAAAAASAPGVTPLSSATRVFAVSKGRMPTPGYGFALEHAELAEETLIVTLGWQQPAADAVLAQMTTHPCLVLALPVAEARTLVVREGDNELARLPL